MVGNVRNKFYGDKGAVQIVEAAFVFPIMFIILFFLIYMGNAHFIKAQVEAVVEARAIEGASYCADPLLESIKKNNGVVPGISSLQTKPYRYITSGIFGDMKSIESNIASAVESDISGKSVSMFKNMKPKIKTSKDKIAKFNNYIVYSTFSVEVEYEIKFPIRFLGATSPTLMVVKSRAEVPVNDTAEFIRNTDMVIDMLSGTKFAKSITDAFGKINDFISNFAKK